MNINFSNYRVYYLITIIGILWATINSALSCIWNYGSLQVFFGPTLLVLAILFFYDKWLWRYPVFKLLVRTPNIAGNYKGEVRFSLKDKVETKKCTLKICQKASVTTLTYSFLNDGERETTSTSKKCFFEYDEDTGICRLLYHYKNEGTQMYHDNLKAHEGFCSLDIIKGKTGMELKGSYFTDRQTKGRLEVRQIKDNQEG